MKSRTGKYFPLKLDNNERLWLVTRPGKVEYVVSSRTPDRMLAKIEPDMSITTHMPQTNSKILLDRLTANKNAFIFQIRVTCFVRYTV